MSKALLPAALEKRLTLRKEMTNGVINCIKFYPSPIPIPIATHKALLEWGNLFATLLERITHCFYNCPESRTKAFLTDTIICFLPSWQNKLLHTYHTADPLAGAHICDDNLSEKSIEWNFGAGGGLEEGDGVARYLESQKKIIAGQSIQGDSIKAVYQSLMQAYLSHCSVNQIAVNHTPVVAYVEHDDIYYSSVRTVRKLSDMGMNIQYAFHHCLKFDGKRLRLPDHPPIDLIYLDCHIEDLAPQHPVIQALMSNSIALDASVFGRLVLRSKAILAMLFDPEIQDELKISYEHRELILKHLAHTRLFLDVNQHPEILSSTSKSVVKIGFGNVFGGKEVKVLSNKDLSVDTILNVKEFKSSLACLMPDHAWALVTDIHVFARKAKIKSLFRELWHISDDSQDIRTFQAFQNMMNQALEAQPRIVYSDFVRLLRTELNRHFANHGAARRLKEKILNHFSNFFAKLLLKERLPIVVQPFLQAHAVPDSHDLFLSHRIHVLFLNGYKAVFVCGSQVFSYKDGKQDNLSKRTCSLIQQG